MDAHVTVVISHCVAMGATFEDLSERIVNDIAKELLKSGTKPL